jgi:hypothetical protein
MRHPPKECTKAVTQGKYVECIDIMEEVVSIKKNVFGTEHIEF